MKKTINLCLVLGILLTFGLACSFNTTTANLSEIKLATDKEGKNEVKTAKVGETLYVLSNLNNALEAYKVRWEVYTENVKGVESGKHLEPFDMEQNVSGSTNIGYTLKLKEGTSNGDYRVKVILLGEGGKEIDSKSAVFKLEGGQDVSENSSDSSKDDSTNNADSADDSTDKDSDKE